jgi:putative addiction module component (TIGR02574 family)
LILDRSSTRFEKQIMLSHALKSELSRLSVGEKLEVFEMIRGSIEPPTEEAFPELDPVQQAELLRRARKAAALPEAGSSWREVKERILGG